MKTKDKALLIALSLCAGTSCVKHQEPNIILIFADDLGINDLGCYGQKLIQTPFIDKMAKEGIKLTNFYTACPVSAPSRFSMLTGKHQGHSYIRSNTGILPFGQYPITDEEVTIAELLKKQGYATSAIGKWSLGSPYNSGDPLKQGFDHFFGYYCQNLAHNYFPDFLWRDGDTVKLRNEVIPVKVNFCDFPLSYATKKVDYSPNLMITEATNFIEKNRSNPFFLYYATTLPHSNGEAPHDEMFEIQDWGIYSDSAWAPVDKGYASMITLLDKQVGMIISKLKELGIEDNTIVIFTSDNGPTLFTPRFNSAGKFRGRKRDLYEAGIREPFIAWWPGKIKAGTIKSLPSATYDLLPTFTELAGLDKPANIDGQSILPTLLGEKEQTNDFLYWEIWEGDRMPKQAIRKGDWKLIRFIFDDPDKMESELYNLKDDPGENKNVADSYPDIVKQLSETIRMEHAEYKKIK